MLPIKLSISAVDRVSYQEDVYYQNGKEWFRCLYIRIYDEKGNLVMETSLHSASGANIKIDNLPNGVVNCS
jgi:hypothetical protein